MSNILPQVKLSKRQEKAISSLSEQAIAEIDCALLELCTDRWLKDSFVIGLMITEGGHAVKDVPDSYYALRLQALARSGHLDSKGVSSAMGFCEYRLANSAPR